MKTENKTGEVNVALTAATSDSMETDQPFSLSPKSLKILQDWIVPSADIDEPLLQCSISNLHNAVSFIVSEWSDSPKHNATIEGNREIRLLLSGLNCIIMEFKSILENEGY